MKTPISVAQNTDHAQCLLAARSRLYTDAKHIHDTRIITVITLAAATIISALVLPGTRSIVGTAGGPLTFGWSLLGGGREKRSRKRPRSSQRSSTPTSSTCHGTPWQRSIPL